jgi:DNA polymerase I
VASTLWLVDGSSYLYRAFHALPPLTSSRGEPTGAVLGVLNMLGRLVKESAPDLIAVVFDAPGRTFRDEIFEQYKSHRPPMPDELRAQIEPLLTAIRAMGLPLLRIEGVEADDVIGTLATRAAQTGLKCVISTGDKDMAQLVSDRITLVNTMTAQTLDREGVKAKFDVYPEQIVDYLALVGDASDNIPGVPKVGPKTAARWLEQYSTLDEIVAHAAAIEGKVGESLRASLEALELSRRLATIRCDVALPSEPRELKPGAPDLPVLRELLTRLELNSLLRQLPQEEGAAPIVPQPPTLDILRSYETVLDDAALDRWIARIEAAALTAFDTETTSLDYMVAEIVGVSLSVTPGEAAYIPLAHRGPGVADQLDRAQVLERLRTWLESEAHAKVGHHLKYDAHVLSNHGIALAGMRYDSMLESYVLNSTATRHDMDSCAAKYLGIHTIKYEDVAGKGAKQIGFDEVPLDRATEYAAEDADVTLRLHRVLWSELEREPQLRAVYETLEQPLVPVLLAMEHRGVLIDAALLKRQSHEIAAKLVESRLNGWPASRSTSIRRSSCRSSCSASSASRWSARPRPASRRLPKTCSRNWPTSTSCHGPSSTTAASRSCVRPTPSACPSRSTRAPAVYTRRITRPSPSPAGCRRPSQTCRTYRSARPRAGASARRSLRHPVTFCWRRIIRRSSSGSWRICRATRACSPPSHRTVTSTRRPRRKSSGCSRRRCRQTSDAPPRRSTSD